MITIVSRDTGKKSKLTEKQFKALKNNPDIFKRFRVLQKAPEPVEVQKKKESLKEAVNESPKKDDKKDVKPTK